MPFLRNKEEQGRPMTVKRKLDGAVDESSGIKIFVNSARLYITFKRSGGLHLVELGLTAGSPAV